MARGGSAGARSGPEARLAARPAGNRQFGIVLHILVLDNDDVPEVILGTQVFALDGTLLFSALPDHGRFNLSYYDVNGDGRLEIVTDTAIYDRRGAPHCAVDETRFELATGFGMATLANQSGRSEPTVAATLFWMAPGSNHVHRLQDLNCNVLRDVDLSKSYSDIGRDFTIVGAAPLFVSEENAWLTMFRHSTRHSDDVALLDGSFKVLNLITGEFQGLVDLDGDGLFEVLVSARAHIDDGRPLGLYAYWAASHSMEFMDGSVPHSWSACALVDTNGDGHGEIICSGRDDATARVYALEGADAHRVRARRSMPRRSTRAG